MNTSRPTSTSSNDSYRNPEGTNETKGSLMSGLAFGVGTEITNTSIQGIQKSGLHPHVENASNKSSQEKGNSDLSTPIFSRRVMRKGQDPCRAQMEQLNQCMQKNDENMGKCQSQYYSFRACRRDNP